MKNFYRILLILGFIPIFFACSQKNKISESHDTYEYFATATEEQGSARLLIKEGAKLELFGVADTLRGELSEQEAGSIKNSLQGIDKWEATYEKNLVDRYESITKITPQGIVSIRRTFNSPAPQPVTDLLKSCSEVVARLRREAANKNKPA